MSILIRWHAAGVLCAFLGSLALASARLAPDDVLVTGGSAGFFLVCGSPAELALLWLWIQSAKRWPAIETQSALRFSVLAAATVLCTLAALVVIAAAPAVFGTDPAPIADAVSDRFSANHAEVTFLCFMFCLWAVLPRLFISSLRGPLALTDRGPRSAPAT